MSSSNNPRGATRPQHEPNPLTRLLAEELPGSSASSHHGTFAPRPGSAASSHDSLPPRELAESVRSGFSGRFGPKGPRGWLNRAFTTAYIAEGAGVKWPWLRYISYYIPCIGWMRKYRVEYLVGDLVAGITMASFYIPMALSLSANLAHLPPIHGLYAFAFQPMVYALLGSCPTMAVGPEAAGSLLLGTAIRLTNAHHTPAFDDGDGEGDDFQNARLAGVITATTGAIAFIAGIVRLGFLDSVLSRPLLRGFISAVGWVIFVDQLIPEMGLNELAKDEQITHASSLTKVLWLIKNATKAHQLTFAVAAVSFSIIMIGRTLKKKFEKRAPYIVFLPDRFLVVVFSAVFTYVCKWDEQGLQVLGNVSQSSGSLFSFHFPFAWQHMTHLRETMSTAFLIAVLGFFESVVAAKSLASGGVGMDVNVSSNRELIALGMANMVGGCFQSLPAFGGYGRSKVNIATGGRTPISSVVLSICTIICIKFLLEWFYYLPRCVLSSMISVVAISLLEEAPEDIHFFYRIGAYNDLATMSLVFLTTLIWSLETGIAIGVGISLIQVIRNSTRTRIQVLGRVPGTSHFRPALTTNDDTASEEQVEEVEGCLIIKLVEGLTFANTGELKNRLRRLERYGDPRAHPSLPRLRNGVHAVIFDVKGVSRLDGSGSKVLKEIVGGYVERGVQVYFARVPREGSRVWERLEKSGIVEAVGGREHFLHTVEEALRIVEGEAGSAGSSGSGAGGRMQEV
ncbi:hypothetical protein RUND412_010299 [Rhizina undulata]